MSKNAKVSTALFSLTIAVVIFTFNNCQPMQAVKGYEGSSSISSTGTGDGNPNDGNGGVPVISATAGQDYFNGTVVPMLKSKCMGCHTTIPIDVMPGGTLAPTDIYTYATVKAKVALGPSAVNNSFINEPLGMNSHTGGNLCPGDTGGTVAPCLQIKTWTLMEYPLLVGSGIAGSVAYISITGLTRGYAIDTKTPALPISVSVYAGGKVGTAGSVLVGTYPANLTGVGIQDGHNFSFNLPANYSDGVRRNLYFYGGTAVDANILPNMPVTYVAYTPKAAGQAYFTNTLQPVLAQQCSRCHGWDYSTAYPDLATQTPLDGGTATNNMFITKMSGGMTHTGGNFCSGGVTSSPCSLVSQWWKLEFGP